MPIFEFQCKKCDKVFEELIRSESEILKLTCPQCSSSNIKKLLSVCSMGGDESSGSGTSSGSFSCPTCSTQSCSTCG